MKHGYNNTRPYEIWENMKQRCYNPKCPMYNYYGGRGITICEEWKNHPEAFVNWALQNGYAEKLTIDRIDNSKGYSPDNCRWVDRKTQSLNRNLQSNNKSGIKNVFWDKSRNKWRVQIDDWSKRFNTKEEAIKARKERLIEIGREEYI